MFSFVDILSTISKLAVSAGSEPGAAATPSMPGADGVAATNVVACDASTGVKTETETSSVRAPVVTRRRHGLTLSVATAEETTEYRYDEFGRVARMLRRSGADDSPTPVVDFGYSPMDDLTRRSVYTNATACVHDRYGCDWKGRRVCETNALGAVVFTEYDGWDQVRGMSGAAYPLVSEHDHRGRRSALVTARTGAPDAWSDVTRWTYDDLTDAVTSKIYADGSAETMTYAADGRPLRRTWPDGRWRERRYDAAGRFAGMGYSTPSMDYELRRDEYGMVTNAVDAQGRRWTYVLGANSVPLAETQTTGGRVNRLDRKVDAFQRPASVSLSVDGAARGGAGYAYDGESRITAISATNAAGRSFSVAYSHRAGYVYGCTISLPDGGALRRMVGRDPFRRELATECSTYHGDRLLDSYRYDYDALGRPVRRNDDRFRYNDRGEVAESAIGGSVYAHEYDGIGSHVMSVVNAATNFYLNNCLNQTVAKLSADAAVTNSIEWHANGGMARDDRWTYTYDDEDRLVSATSIDLTNGAYRVLNDYDYLHRRIRKTVQRYDLPSAEWRTSEVRDFVYDGWNLVNEFVAAVDGATTNITEIQYFWGLDLSGTLQGAGGVGGLLAVSRDGSFHFPVYDNNGNVMKYVDESGAVVAAYVYDDFGNTISRAGSLADFFRHCFSTKYFDAETGLYYYGYRFYHPALKRWPNRDPVEEKDCINVYAFCSNDAISKVDNLGMYTFYDSPTVVGWYFGVYKSVCDDYKVVAKYTMNESERKCCYSVKVDRYVKKILGIGNAYGKYSLDVGGDSVMKSIDEPYTGYAEGDTPDGQTLFVYRMPWTQSFKFVAKCTEGPNKGKVLSSVEKKFKTDGHFLWTSPNGSFLK